MHQTASSEQLGTSLTGSLPFDKPRDLDMSFDDLDSFAMDTIPNIAVSYADNAYTANNMLPHSHLGAAHGFRAQPMQYREQALRNRSMHVAFLHPAAARRRAHSTGGILDSTLAHRQVQAAMNRGPRRARKRATPVISHATPSAKRPASSLEPPLSAFMDLPPGGANILDGWLEQETAKGLLPFIPEGRVLWKLAGDTGIKPASVHAWISQRIGVPLDSNGISAEPYNTSIAGETRLVPCGAMLRKLEDFIRVREGKSCAPNSTSTGTKYHCPDYPQCKACFATPGGWRRHQDIRFPCEFFLCIQCGGIFDRHVREHLVGTEGVDVERWEEFRIELDYDPDGVKQPCTYQSCDRCFQGTRTAAWNELQDHIFNDHIRHNASQEGVPTPPPSWPGGSDGPSAGGRKPSGYDHNGHYIFGSGPAYEQGNRAGPGPGSGPQGYGQASQRPSDQWQSKADNWSETTIEYPNRHAEDVTRGRTEMRQPSIQISSTAVVAHHAPSLDDDSCYELDSLWIGAALDTDHIVVQTSDEDDDTINRRKEPTPTLDLAALGTLGHYVNDPAPSRHKHCDIPGDMVRYANDRKLSLLHGHLSYASSRPIAATEDAKRSKQEQTKTLEVKGLKRYPKLQHNIEFIRRRELACTKPASIISPMPIRYVALSAAHRQLQLSLGQTDYVKHHAQNELDERVLLSLYVVWSKSRRSPGSVPEDGRKKQLLRLMRKLIATQAKAMDDLPGYREAPRERSM